MEKTKEELINKIMEESRHQFIYGYNGKLREQFLRDMAKKYPVKLDDREPIGIYLDSIGLSKRYDANNDLVKTPLSIISREYLYFSIVKNLLDVTLEQLLEKDLIARSEQFLNTINRFFIDDKKIKVKNLRELRDILKDARDAYSVIYENYIENSILDESFNRLPIKFIYIDKFIREYKDMINNKSYIGVIIDQQEPIVVKSKQAINSLVASRINADISMKIACQPDEWKMYYDLNGTLIEYIHDYNIVQFDDSYNEYMKKNNRKFRF